MRPGVVFIGMETSGALRRRFQAKGFRTFSCDLLPSEDYGEIPGPLGWHMRGDVFAALEYLRSRGIWPDLAIFHPDCTYLTSSAEWAYKDPDFIRYPGVGYHQRLQPGTLFGAARRDARERALTTVRRILAEKIRLKAVENPVGAISRVRRFDQIVQPNWFGDDASKKTGLILDGLPPLKPTRLVAPRIVNGKPRWANQTDTGQNRLSPGAERWKDRARTYDGIADAMVEQWSPLVGAVSIAEAA